MRVRSLGWRTDLALLRLAGSLVTPQEDCVVVRTPSNPAFHWGNFVLLPHPPSAAQLSKWLERYAALFPGSEHVAFGVDGTNGSRADLEPLAQLGFEVEASVVMTSRRVQLPARPNLAVQVRAFDSDRDWAQSLQLSLDCAAADEAATPEPPAQGAAGQGAAGQEPIAKAGAPQPSSPESLVEWLRAGNANSERQDARLLGVGRPADQNPAADGAGFREFAQRRTAAERRLVTQGHGAWFGAFEGSRLRSQLGLVDAGDGLGRFQSVETHPDSRGRGMAGTLIHYASGFGLDQLRASTLVIVADPDYPAIRLYRSVGFADAQIQLQATRH